MPTPNSHFSLLLTTLVIECHYYFYEFILPSLCDINSILIATQSCSPKDPLLLTILQQVTNPMIYSYSCPIQANYSPISYNEIDNYLSQIIGKQLTDYVISNKILSIFIKRLFTTKNPLTQYLP